VAQETTDDILVEFNFKHHDRQNFVLSGCF